MASIFIVEDDDALSSELADALTDLGHTVETARDGREALVRLSAGHIPDAILLDLMMPVMNGWQFRARQLALPAFAAIPTIVMSAIDNLERAAITADEFLPKPVHFDDLGATIERCLRGEEPAHANPDPEPWLPPLQMQSQVPSWGLVAPRRGESCRWEDGTGRWISISLGEGDDLGMVLVSFWGNERRSFERYEEALSFTRNLRG